KTPCVRFCDFMRSRPLHKTNIYMTNWIISNTALHSKYLILTEKAFWLTDQNNNLDIHELIANNRLGNIKSIRYDDLKEIIFNDTDLIIEFKFKDDSLSEESYPVQKSVYPEIKDYLKSHLKGIEVKDYSILKQIFPHLTILAISVIVFFATYFSALEIQKGESINIAGRRAWFKQLIISVAEVLGPIGTIIVGVLIISILTYFIFRKYKNPKKGEIIQIKRSPQLIVPHSAH
ncbi:MAG: hypothetical protein R3206_08280, partial [Salegentibacter mishustinae]|nr:hypothetical protein [Salegentibacter mishustinae]